MTAEAVPPVAARGRRRRRLVWIAVGVVVVVLVAVAVAAFAYPAGGAAVCPRCYGLVRLREAVYAERGLSTEQQARIIAVVDEANRLVGDFYGGRITSPSVLACVSAQCYSRIGGGGERGVAVLDRAVMLSPQGIDAVIAAHEMSHVEFHQRLGSARKQVPQWFDEGLAVVVSNDSRYLLPTPAGDRCRIAADDPLPTDLDGWQRMARADAQAYAKAACRVSRWLVAEGGPPAVLSLIDRLTGGEAFATVVGH